MGYGVFVAAVGEEVVEGDAIGGEGGVKDGVGGVPIAGGGLEMEGDGADGGEVGGEGEGYRRGSGGKFGVRSSELLGVES